MNYPPPALRAGKAPLVKFDPTGNKLLVNEIFYSLQGEGLRTGRPTVFIRLSKCNMKCAWCDTEYETGQLRSVDDIVDEALFSLRTSDSVRGVLVDLTGGEPMLQNFAPLVDALRQAGFRDIGIETSGTVWNDAAHKLDWVTVSPKAGIKRIPSELLKIADEIKWVVDKNFMQLYGKKPEELYVPGIINFLQPESMKEDETRWASSLCLWHPDKYRLSLQTHKAAGNR